MSHYVNAAAIHFRNRSTRGAPGATQEVLDQLKQGLEQLEDSNIDLVLTCEGVESIGQTLEQAESPDEPGPFYTTYRDFAIRNKATVAGSIKFKEDGKVYNSIVIIGPDGNYLGDYRKTFLTQGERELGLTRGNGPVVVNTPAGRLGGVICFDLNYDELRNGYHKLKPDIMLFSSMFHGEHLQQSWAHHCRSYFISACKDNNSDIVDPLGRVIQSINFHGRVVRARLNLDRFIMHQDVNMRQFRDIYRKYGNGVSIDFNPKLGQAILYCESNGTTAPEIAREFELTPLDDYLTNSKNALPSVTMEGRVMP